MGIYTNNQEIISIKQIVEEILMTDERSRNSDTWLIIETLRSLGFKVFIDYSQLKKMPSFETITRIRRKLNQENLYLPTFEVSKLREKRQEEYRDLFKNSNLSW